MRRIFTRFCLPVLILLVAFRYPLQAQQPTDLLISEYIEGSSNNKAIELYNGTGAPINLTADNYVIAMYFNGGTTATLTIPLTGTIAPGGVFVLAHGSATFAGAAFVNQTNSSGWFNGDDVVMLRKGGVSGTIIDAIGQLGFDPGAEWGTGLTSTADNTLRRKAADCTGDNNTSDAFDPSVKYDGFAQDDFSGLGSFSSSCVVSGPSIQINPLSLNFSTTVGTPSGQQTYFVQGNSLTSDITVTVPALSNFGASLVSGGPYTSTVTIPFADANAAPVTVYVVFSPAVAGTQTGNITNVSGTVSANVAVQGSTTTSGGITPIYIIQGTGQASTLDGTVVTTEGIVTADFQGPNQINGFFIQDTTGDGNALTSDGVFVFNTTFPVAVGDYVRLTAEVDEFNNLTELKNLTSLTILSSGNSLKPPTQVSLPVSAVTDLERYEGMLVIFPQTLTATETFTLGRFGEVALSASGRLFNPTNFVDPNDNPASGHNSSGTSNVGAVLAQQSLNDRNRILLDDGSNVQNPPVVPYLNPADTTFRIGTTVTNLTGVLHFDFSEYRLNPTTAPSFEYAPRPAVPEVGAANVKVASFNVLNYFNGNGSGGGFPTSRGANTLAEFNRQRTKIIAAISQLNADVIGLMEIENDGNSATSAITDLVNGLNAVTAPGTYAAVIDPSGGANGTSGTDEIKVAMIYKPGVVTPVGTSKADTDPVHNRPPLAQTFSLANGEKFTVIVNHFKSKSSTGASGANADQGDGQGAFNFSRKQQATALLAFIASLQAATGDADMVCVGDYNAYEQEDPIDILTENVLTNVLPNTHSYVFEGQSGTLDYALITGGLQAHLTGADRWHINADEPIAKDYNQEFNPAYLFSPGPYRSSDHDPVLIGLNLQPAAQSPVVAITSPANGSSFPVGTNVTVTAEASDPDGTIVKVDFYANGFKLGVDSTAPYQLSGAPAEAGTFQVTAVAFDNSGDSTVSDTVAITFVNCAGNGTILAEGFTNIPGNLLINLASNPNYPNNPDITAQLTSFEYGPNVTDNYGGRVRGYICAPQTGFYTFYISSDEQSELWLSTDDQPANMRRIAYVSTKTGFRSWFTSATQRSVSIRLIKGVRYYIETIHKEGTGTDHLSVGWLLPNGTFQGPIAGSNLSPWSTPAPALNGSNNFATAMREIQGRIDEARELTVSVLPNPSPRAFTLVTRSNSDKTLSITVTDVMGRIVETRTGVAANGRIEIGSKLNAGVYFVEVLQDGQRKKLKLIRQ